LTLRTPWCTVYTMKRTNHYIPPQQLKELKRESKASGLSVSELIRTAISEWLARRTAGK
jgi:Arc/MetJ-type ribon-helix-helix transcriptional regulator